MSDLVWPVAPPPVAKPDLAEVWVAALVVTAVISRRNVAVTQPLSSAGNLFAPVVDETITRALVVAAAATEEECRRALSEWHVSHPDVHGEDIVSKVPFGLVSAGERGGPEAVKHCQECEAPIPGGLGFFCERCTKAMWARSKADFGDEP